MRIHKYDIILSENVIVTLNKYIQNDNNKHESGGILLGQVKDNSIYILKSSIPGVSDKSSRYSFERNKESAQNIVNYEFENSGGKTIYLGEWHTHPEKNPTPSGQDMKMIKGQLRLGKLNEKFILLLIQGTDSRYVGVYEDDKMHT